MKFIIELIWIRGLHPPPPEEGLGNMVRIDAAPIPNHQQPIPHGFRLCMDWMR